MSRGAWIEATAARFAAADLADARLEARDLLLHALSIDRDRLDGGTPLALADMGRLDALATRRLDGVPLDRILGEREFRGRVFKLNADTLAPREDSGAVIDLALEMAQTNGMSRVLDLGTGSGILLLTLLAERAGASGIGIDLSRDATMMARFNSERLGLADRAEFLTSDWFSSVTERFDLVVSNPPYIPSGAIADLEREVREHDPLRALDGGDDGLDAYRSIARGLVGALLPLGMAVLEIGHGQQAEVVDIFRGAGFLPAGIRNDLGGVARAVAFKHRGNDAKLT